MHIKLWNSPYNGGWIWFSKRNLKRCQIEWNKPKLWWAIFGFSGSITLQSWPFQKYPNYRAVDPQ